MASVLSMATTDSPSFRLQVYTVRGTRCSFVMTSHLQGWKIRTVRLSGTQTSDGRTLWACGRCHAAQASRGALLQSHERLGTTYERLICHDCYLEQSNGSDTMELTDLPDCFTARWRQAAGWPVSLDRRQ